MDYIKRALSEDCLPVELEYRGEYLDRSILDPVCRDTPDFLSCDLDFIFRSATNSRLLGLLSDSIDKIGKDKFVLSLSGGVDSMTHLVLLVALARIRHKSIKFIACHIRHSARTNETELEQIWVSWACHKLGVKLYAHHVEVARPHGDDNRGGGLSRDEFEEYTRQIRFTMYRRAFYAEFGTATEGPSPVVVVMIGHHLDDVDENRLAELGKGNLIEIDGMAEEGSGCSNVVQLRPLCSSVRKSDLRCLATDLNLPYMKNSTPQWSRRGWIRSVIDSMSSSGIDIQARLMVAGNASRLLSDEIKDIAVKWRDNKGIEDIEIDLGNSRILKLARLDLGTLAQLLEGISGTAKSALHAAREVEAVWNPSVQHHASRTKAVCPIQLINSRSIDENLKYILYREIFRQCFDSIKRFVCDKPISSRTVRHIISSANAGGGAVTFSALQKEGFSYLYVKKKHWLCFMHEPEIVLNWFDGKGSSLSKCLSAKLK